MDHFSPIFTPLYLSFLSFRFVSTHTTRKKHTKRERSVLLLLHQNCRSNNLNIAWSAIVRFQFGGTLALFMGLVVPDLLDDGGGGMVGPAISGGASANVFCSICLESVISDGDRSTARLQCGHQFHLGRWWEISSFLGRRIFRIFSLFFGAFFFSPRCRGWIFVGMIYRHGSDFSDFGGMMRFSSFF